MDLAVRIFAFFQHMPPYSGAAALRGHSVVGGLVAARGQQAWDIRVFTTTPMATPIPGASIVSLSVPQVENAESLLSRIIGEFRMGMAASKAMFSKPSCDLVVISTPGYLAALVLAARARRRKIPYVLEMRDVYPQVYTEAGLIKRNSLVFRIFSELSRRMYAGARIVVTATRGLAREVSQESPNACVVCVYNGFPSGLRGRKVAKHARFTVCFHGTMGFFQDIESLIEVARRLEEHDVDMVVIGYGRKETLLRGQSLSNLQFLGRQSFEATIASIERCHLGLCLRLDDGISKDAFPVKVWEYLGLGIPSIVTPPCEAGEFLETQGCGLQAKAGDVEGLVQAVMNLKQDPGVLEEMSRQCHRAASEYTRERTGLAVAELIERAMRASGSH